MGLIWFQNNDEAHLNALAETICYSIGRLVCRHQQGFGFEAHSLTRRGRVTHLCVSKLAITGSDNGLLPGRCRAIIWTNTWILLIRNWETKFSEILNEIRTSSFNKMRLKVSFAKWRPFFLGLIVLRIPHFESCVIRIAIHCLESFQRNYPSAAISLPRMSS